MKKYYKKLSEIIGKINCYIRNMKEWKWMLITFVVCLLSIISISVRILWEPYLLAEDGYEFLKCAFFDGIKSITYLYGGYLGILPRLFALIALYFGKKYNSLVLIAYIMKTFSIIYSVIVANYFNSTEFKFFIKNRILRLLVSMLIIFVVGNQTYMLYNITTIHWWGGLLAFLVGFNLLNNKMPPLYIMPFLLLAVLSSPSALIIILPVLYYLYNKAKLVRHESLTNAKKMLSNNKVQILKLLLIIITIIIEIGSILSAPIIDTEPTSDLRISLSNFTKVIFETLKSTFRNIPYSFSFAGLSKIIGTEALLIIGMILLTIIIWRCIKNNKIKELIWCISGIMLIYFMNFFKYDGVLDLPSHSFYNSIPAVAGVLLFIKWIYDDFYNKKCKIIRICTIIFIISITILFRKYCIAPNYKYCNNIFSIEKYVNFSSSKIEEVEIMPGGKWKVYVPVNQ